MLKSTPVKVPAADVATLAPSFTTTATVEHEGSIRQLAFQINCNE